MKKLILLILTSIVLFSFVFGVSADEKGGPTSSNCKEITTKELCKNYSADICVWNEKTNSCVAKNEECTQDSDCACGVSKETGDCFVGNKEFVDTTNQCPDFCSGIAGNFVTKCVDNRCSKVDMNAQKECAQDSDCKYFGYANNCYTPQDMVKKQEEMRQKGIFVGEDWTGLYKNITCKCENNKCKKSVEQNNTFTLSNSRKAEIKLMPETASERAIERLGQIGFNLTLKEVGPGDNAKVAYHFEAEKEYKIFGFMKKQAKVETDIDAETGEVISVKKPWWSFLASEV